MRAGDGEARFSSVVFYDLETTGRNPRDARITQFAAVRTTPDLKTVTERESFLVRPDDDVVPEPAALVMSRMEPSRLRAEGIPEPEAAERIRAFFGKPRTLRCGWNSIVFDDELVRHVLWRSLRPPYEEEWRDGNARMDVQTLWRAASVLAAGIVDEWPLNSRGRPAYALGKIAAAAGVQARGELHDAGTDCGVLLGLARRVRTDAREVWEHGLSCTADADGREDALKAGIAEAWLYAEHGRAPSMRGCRVVTPLESGPWPGYVTLMDVAKAEGPEYLARTSEERIRGFARRDANGKRKRSLPVLQAGLKKNPFLLRLGGNGTAGELNRAVVAEVLARLGRPVSAAVLARRLDFVADNLEGFRTAARAIRETDEEARRVKEDAEGERDAERALYGGGFPRDGELRRCRALIGRLREGEGGAEYVREQARAIGDPRLRVLTARYAAKHAAAGGTVPAEWTEAWREHARKCRAEGFGSRPSAAEFRKKLDAVQEAAEEHDPVQRAVAAELEEAWTREYAAYAPAEGAACAEQDREADGC